MKDVYVGSKKAMTILKCNNTRLYNIYKSRNCPVWFSKPISVNGKLMWREADLIRFRDEVMLEDTPEVDITGMITVEEAAKILGRKLKMCYPSCKYSPLRGIAKVRVKRQLYYKRSEVEALVKDNNTERYSSYVIGTPVQFNCI